MSAMSSDIAGCASWFAAEAGWTLHLMQAGGVVHHSTHVVVCCAKRVVSGVRQGRGTGAGYLHWWKTCQSITYHITSHRPPSSPLCTAVLTCNASPPESLHTAAAIVRGRPCVRGVSCKHTAALLCPLNRRCRHAPLHAAAPQCLAVRPAAVVPWHWAVARSGS